MLGKPLPINFTTKFYLQVSCNGEKCCILRSSTLFNSCCFKNSCNFIFSYVLLLFANSLVLLFILPLHFNYHNE